MAMFFSLLALTALLGGACLITGRLLAVALPIPLLRRPGPESLMASAVLGTGLLPLAFGWGSHAGLPARFCLLVVAALLAGLALRTWQRGRLGEFLRRPVPARDSAAILLAMALRGAVALLPIAVGGVYYFFSDAMTYVAVADWLRDHGFGVPVPPETTEPAGFLTWQLQSMNHRMGPIFLLALVGTVLPDRLGLELYPVVLAWGAALNIGSIFLLCRWSLGLSRMASLAGAFLTALALNSLVVSTSQNFLCQVYGTAILACGLATLSRLMSPMRWRAGNAVMLGLLVAAQLSCYGELSPVLVLAALACGAVALARGHGRGALRFTGLAGLAGVVLANVEVMRAAHGILFMSQLNGVGRHLEYAPLDYLHLAVGYYPMHPFVVPGRGQWPLEATFTVALLALLAGLVAVVTRHRALPLTAAMLVVLGLAAYFSFLARDPWTGQPGHTWNLFKICKWSFPLVAAAQVAGLAALARRLPGRRALLPLLGAGLLGAALPHHYREARCVVEGTWGPFGRPVSLAHLRKLQQRVAAKEPSSIYFISAPEGPWPRCFAGLFFSRHPFASGWRGSVFLEGPGLMDDRPQRIDKGTLFLVPFEPPFEEPQERLPLGYCVVDGQRPLIFRVGDGPVGPGVSPGGSVPLGPAPLRLWVFAPHAGPAVLSFNLEPGARRLTVSDGHGSPRTVAVEASPAGQVALPIVLRAGVSCVELVCPGPPAAPPANGPSLPWPAIRAARLELAGPVGAGAWPCRNSRDSVWSRP